MIETDLFEFAYVPDWYRQLDELSNLALPEQWKFKRPIYKTKNVETVVLLTKEAPKKGNFIGEVSGEKRDIDTAFGIQQKVLEEINTLAEKYKIDKVILFGLRARGDYKEVSDIDLAVSDGDVNEFTLAVDAETSTLLEYDVVNLDGSVQEELRKSIEREGKMLYEKI